MMIGFYIANTLGSGIVVTSVTHTVILLSIDVAFAIMLPVIDIDLMCGSRNAIESLLHPTTFCTISGKAIAFACMHFKLH